MSFLKVREQAGHRKTPAPDATDEKKLLAPISTRQLGQRFLAMVNL